MLLMRLLLPLPLGPVTTVKQPRGMLTLMLRSVLALAPLIVNQPLGGSTKEDQSLHDAEMSARSVGMAMRRLLGTSIRLAPLINGPVIEPFCLTICLGEP